MDGPKARTPVSVQQLLSLEAPLFPLSSRPERSAVERSAVSFPPYSLRCTPAAATRSLNVQDVALGQVLAAFAW